MVRPQESFLVRRMRELGGKRAFQDRLDTLSALAPNLTNISGSTTSEPHLGETAITTFLDVVGQLSKVPVVEVSGLEQYSYEWKMENPGMTDEVLITVPAYLAWSHFWYVVC